MKYVFGSKNSKLKITLFLIDTIVNTDYQQIQSQHTVGSKMHNNRTIPFFIDTVNI